MRVDFAGHRFAAHDLADLLFQLFDGLGAGAGNSLVARGEDALHTEGLVQRVQGHQANGGGAVRVGDDALMRGHVGRVDLGNHQRDGRVLAEVAGVVDHHAAGLDRGRGVVARNRSAGAEESDVDPGERIMGQLFDGDFSAPEGELFADRAGRGQQGQFADRKVAALQGPDHLDANGTGGTDHGHMGTALHKVGAG